MLSRPLLQTARDDDIVVLVGLTHVEVTVGNPANGRKSARVRCLIDSGAIYSLVPAAVLRRLGIKPHSTREFVLANGEVIRRKLATATFEYLGHRGDSMVIVGEPGDEALLGATTLEGFGFVLDRFAVSCDRCSSPSNDPRRTFPPAQRT